ncbi:hypothetical protein emb_1d0802 [Coriobacteriaceae bacterium EMTCatB1]|nr:hypothetical protein emb_1d0802 [Coriobacteriaceae bacterium EMTCatB1]
MRPPLSSLFARFLPRRDVLAPVDPAVVAPVDDVPDLVVEDAGKARGVVRVDDDATGLVVADRLVALRVTEAHCRSFEDRVLGDQPGEYPAGLGELVAGGGGGPRARRLRLRRRRCGSRPLGCRRTARLRSRHRRELLLRGSGNERRILERHRRDCRLNGLDDRSDREAGGRVITRKDRYRGCDESHCGDRQQRREPGAARQCLLHLERPFSSQSAKPARTPREGLLRVRAGVRASALPRQPGCRGRSPSCRPVALRRPPFGGGAFFGVRPVFASQSPYTCSIGTGDAAL